MIVANLAAENRIIFKISFKKQYPEGCEQSPLRLLSQQHIIYLIFNCFYIFVLFCIERPIFHYCVFKHYQSTLNNFEYFKIALYQDSSNWGPLHLLLLFFIKLKIKSTLYIGEVQVGPLSKIIVKAPS